MTMNRRRFIKNSALLATSLPLTRSNLLARKPPIGIQLWSLNEQIKKDYLAAIQSVARAGYSFVETAEYDMVKGLFYKRSPQKFKQELQEGGLKAISAHVNFRLSEAEKVINDAREAGVENIIIPSLGAGRRKTLDDYQRIAEEFNEIGAIAQKSGIRFGYHNHAFEFEEMNNQLPYDILLQNTDPSYVIFQMDLGWVIYSGHQPETFFRKYPRRFPLWHIRNFNKENKGVPVGTGVVNNKELFKLKKEAGFELGFVELPSDSDSEAITKSIQYLKAHKLY